MDLKNEAFFLKQYPVLIVDDEQVALDLFRYNFSDEFDVCTARSAQEALEILEQRDIALVLSDQRMAGMSGTEFFAEIQKKHPDIIRILVTGYVDFQSMVEAINAGHVYHYVEKPWDDDELRLIIKRGLEHFHLVRERDRLQEERIRTLEQMARSNRLSAVGTLAAGIAHEIRNPLSAIITFHQMLPEKIEEIRLNPESVNDEFWTTFSKLPLREVERIKRLIQELLDFSRDSGSHYRLDRMDLREVLASILPIVETDIRRKNIDVIKQFDPELWQVNADADKIKQVVINLLLNSMHATPAGGTITLRLVNSIELNGCEIWVEDTGSGINPEHLEKVFDPFFTTRDPGLGTGLGLTMCHYIVTHHGGTLEITSEPGNGTKVRVFLPRAVSDVQEVAEPAVAELTH